MSVESGGTKSEDFFAMHEVHKEREGLTRRRFGTGAAVSLALPSGIFTEWLSGDARRKSQPSRTATDPYAEVVPENGVNAGVIFGDALQRLVAAGGLDPERLRALYEFGLPAWVERLLATPSAEPIVFTRDRAPYLVNLLWPIGLANRAAFNDKSPIADIQLPSYASTGGWTLGRAPNGYVYFNSIPAVPLTPTQEALVLEIARSTFRPCCDNSTLFQDCNHGSALLGLIELAASQGVRVDRIYRVALVANSYWFPQVYAKTALAFRYFGGIRWRHAPARLALGPRYSSLSGWREHVEAPLRRAKLQPPPEPGSEPAGCGV